LTTETMLKSAPCRVRGMAAAVLLCWPGLASAGELGAFNDAVAAAYAHYRGAVFYARTGNLGVGAVELEQMAAKWRAVLDRFAAAPPDAFADDPAWGETLRRVGRRIADAGAAARRGDADATRAALAPIRPELAGLRRRNNVVVFSDCVDELQAAVDAIWSYRREPPDFTSAEALDRFKARLGVVAYMFRRCHARAPAAAAKSAEFNRLFESARDTLSRLRRALNDGDSKGLINTLRELRSLDQMLFLRFG
jgi:hypothetical protein